MTEAHAFWTTDRLTGDIRSEMLPEPGADEVRVRALYSGVSRGSEALVFAGQVPESEHQRMRCPFQDGDFPFPVKYGYASVGLVEDGPAALKDRVVFCLYPHQDRYVVPADAVVPLPGDLSAKRAVLGANAETALNALWDAAPRVGDRIAVVGGGVVGVLVAALAARIPGTQVQLIDTDAKKETTARVLDVPFAAPEDAVGDCDLVVHATGRGTGLGTAIGLAGFEATVLELSWYGAGDVPAPLGGAFHSQRLTLQSSQVGAVSPARRARRTHRQRLAQALDLLRDPMFGHLVSGESRFDELPETMQTLANDPPAGTLCHRIAYPDPA
jgi:NADPH:quinone reductase-like Zn-dependent oxidoreductase